MPALPPCRRRVTLWPEHRSRQLPLGHRVAPTAAPPLPALSSGPRQGPDPAVSLPPLLPLPLFCAQPSLPWPLPPLPYPVSHPHHPRPCSGSSLGVQTFTSPWVCAHRAARVSRERRKLGPGCLSRWGQGPRRHGSPATTSPPAPSCPPHSPHPPPPHAEPRALQLTGIWACLCATRSVRVSCGLGGHVRDWHRCREGEYALVSSRFTNTAHPACPPSLGSGSSGLHRVQSPNLAPRTLHPTARSHIWSGMGNLELPATRACPWGHHTVSPTPEDTTQVGPDCEGGGLRGRQQSGFGPATREPPGRPRTGSGREGTPHFSPRDGWGPRELAARLRARHIPLGTAGFLG